MNKPYIVAEIGANHGSDYGTLREIISAAARAGADAVKVQTWNRMTVAPNFVIPTGPWAGHQLGALYEEARLDPGLHAVAFDEARDQGVDIFSTPFDEESVDMLESTYDPSRYKIASFEITHLPLLRKVAETGKPVILSTGLATLAEINEAVTTLGEGGCADITLLVCSSQYPASSRNTHLAGMVYLRDLYQCKIGISDHTFGPEAAVAATALGADVIEKHIMLDGQGRELDGGFATHPHDFKAMVEQCRAIAAALQHAPRAFGPRTQEERANLLFRRAVWSTAPIKAGEAFTPENVGVYRPLVVPGAVLPRDLERLYDRKATHDIPANAPIATWDVVDTEGF